MSFAFLGRHFDLFLICVSVCVVELLSAKITKTIHSLYVMLSSIQGSTV